MNETRKCSSCKLDLSVEMFSPSNHRCRRCQQDINSMRNAERNHISSRAQKLADTSKSDFYSLPREQRLEWRKIAKTLNDLGATYGDAERAEKRRKDGVVYVMTHPAMRGVKIGKAFDPDSRLQSYQTGCPDRAYKMAWVSPYVDDASTLEKEIHSLLHRYRMNGEWFDLSVSDVNFFSDHLVRRAIRLSK